TYLPCGNRVSHKVRHGQGYSFFESVSRELEQEVLVFVAADDPIKVIRLRVRNQGRSTRKLTATLYLELVLGTVREKTAPYIITQVDPDSDALLARNFFDAEFPSRVTFVDVNVRPRTFTTSRNRFLGRNGSVSAPVALKQVGLSETVGAAFDPCAVLQVPLELGPGKEQEVAFFVGQAA